MVQGLRKLATLVEAPGSVPSTHGGSQLLVTPVAGDLSPSSALPGYCMYMGLVHTSKQYS